MRILIVLSLYSSVTLAITKQIEDVIPITVSNINGHSTLWKKGWWIISSSKQAFSSAHRFSYTDSVGAIDRFSLNIAKNSDNLSRSLGKIPTRMVATWSMINRSAKSFEDSLNLSAESVDSRLKKRSYGISKDIDHSWDAPRQWRQQLISAKATFSLAKVRAVESENSIVANYHILKGLLFSTGHIAQSAGHLTYGPIRLASKYSQYAVLCTLGTTTWLLAQGVGGGTAMTAKLVSPILSAGTSTLNAGARVFLHSGIYLKDFSVVSANLLWGQTKALSTISYNLATATPAHIAMGTMDTVLFAFWDGPHLAIAYANGEL